MGVIRRYDESDARRDALVEAMKRHVRAARPDTDYDADIEYIETAGWALLLDEIDKLPTPGGQ
jgi:hypothetical protein